MKKEKLDELVFDFAADQLIYFVASERQFIAARLTETVQRLSGHGLAGKLKLWFLKRFLSEKEASDLLEEVLPHLRRELGKGEAASIRQSIEQILEHYIVKLESDEALRAVINEHMRVIAKRAELEGLLKTLNTWLADFLEKQLELIEEKRFIGLREAFQTILAELKANELVLDELDAMLKKAIKVILDSDVIVSELGAIAQKEVLRMSDEHLVTFIEEKVGNDLQYIRLNGAVLGGLVGALLYLVKALL